MEAAEAIGDWLHGGRDPAALDAVAERINAIFEACTFQDLTGQRIRRAIEHLQHVESMLSEIMPTDAMSEAPPLEEPEAQTPDLGQNAIDELFG